MEHLEAKLYLVPNTMELDHKINRQKSVDPENLVKVRLDKKQINLNNEWQVFSITHRMV
jgi:hypothetical protein